MNHSPILYQEENQVAWITLNRPDKLNSFNREMALLLQEALDRAAASKEIRAVHITGMGKGFSAGQDLAEVVAADGPSMEQILAEHYNPIILRISRLEKPIVAAVNGVAAGAGANIALACDIVVASESASFIQAFSKIGLIPDSGGTYHLPRLIGWQRATAYMLLGEKITAEEAVNMGMIYKSWSAEIFKAESEKMVLTLAQMPTKALSLTKKALKDACLNNLEEQLALENQFQQQAAATDDFNEGVAAFLEKRTPIFKGC
jgi:2-(1,2-epoxy-1,2-dihydrophenyl)acetyl-CoA isomerase